jgi:hypothetical protein
MDNYHTVSLGPKRTIVRGGTPEMLAHAHRNLFNLLVAVFAGLAGMAEEMHSRRGAMR